MTGEHDAPGEGASDGTRVERLHAIAADMMACRTESDVYQLTVAAAERVLAFDICGVDAVEDGGLVPKAVSAEMADVGYQRSTVEEGGLAGEAYRTGESIVTDDVRDSAVADPATDEYRAILTVPMGDVGVFQTGSRTPGAFDDDDRELAELLVAHAEEALRRIRFETALRERNRTIERLHETAAELVACETEEAVIARVLAAAEEVLELEVCVLLLSRQAEEGLEVVAATDDPRAPDAGTVLEGESNAAWRTFEDGESLQFGDVAEAETPRPYHEAYRSAISVPLGDVGVLQAIATEPETLDEDDVELAELLASQAGEVVSRMRAERRRTDERDRLAALFRKVPDPAASVALEDDRAVARAVNPAFEEVFGYDEGTVVGEDLDRYIVPDDERDAARSVTTSAGRGESFHTETTRVTADGERREFLLHVVPVERSPGNPGAYAIYTDITDRKRRERRLGALHESARRLMAADDPRAVCERAVEAARETLGLPVSGVYLREGGRLEAVALTDAAGALFGGDPPTCGPDDETIWGTYERGEPRVVRDIEPDCLESDEAPESVLAIPLGDRGVFLSAAFTPGVFDDQVVDLAGVLAATVETALGRTEREQTLREREGELERKNDRLEQFASVVSHDLRNPLSVAQGNLDLARQTGDEEFFEKVETAHGRMETLIGDLLALARGGEVTGETERVPLSEVARRAWVSVDASGATLDADVDAAVDADRERLVQLLENLFLNAVEHGSTGSRTESDDAVEHGSTSPRDGEDAVEHGGEDVTITLGTTGDGFYVADDGPGIPPETREQVLEYGYTTADGGTGLGLAIVDEIAKGHGWAFAVGESESGGARFDVQTG